MKRRQSGNVVEFSPEVIEFIRYYYDKWRSKSIFQVLLQYRAQKYQELYNLSQQVHFQLYLKTYNSYCSRYTYTIKMSSIIVNNLTILI